VDIDPEGLQSQESHLYLEADYDIECSTSRYRLGVVWASFFVAVYPIGIPCLYFYVLRGAKDMIQHQAAARVHELDLPGVQQLERNAMALSSIRFLFQEYEPEVSEHDVLTACVSNEKCIFVPPTHTHTD
jgi:hypothetical protein